MNRVQRVNPTQKRGKMILLRVRFPYSFILSVLMCMLLRSVVIKGSLLTPQAVLPHELTTANLTSDAESLTPKNTLISSVENKTSAESSEEDSEEGDDEDEEDDEEDEEMNSSTNNAVPATPKPQPVLLETKTVYVTQNHVTDSATEVMNILKSTNISEAASKETFQARNPLPVRQKDEPGLFPPEDPNDALLEILQTAVRETYLAFKGNAVKKKKEDLQQLEDNLKGQIQNLDIDLNAKIMAIDSNANSRITTLTEQIVTQRKEDILTFSDNLNQIAKANQVHLETLHSETQHLKVTVDGLNKGQASLSAKMSQLQKTMHSLESKINEIVVKNTEDFALVQTTQKTLAVLVDSMEKDIRSTESALSHIQNKLGDLEKAKVEDSNKVADTGNNLRKTLIRDQKQDPVSACIRHLKNRNVGGALKQWRMIEQITEDLKETLPADMSKIIEDSYSKSPVNLPQIVEFIHRAVSHGERRLKEAAYSSLLNKMDQAKHLTARGKILEVFNAAQHMKSDLGSYYNTSSSTAEIISKLPEAVRLVTFEKVKLFLPSRGYLRVSADRKVSLVPQDARFFEKDEILWQFEYDKDKTDGTFYIKSDKLQKYLVTIHEGFNSYGFSRQALFMTGNRKENGTRFDISNINGDHVLLKSIFYNGYLTWKSNIQTIYGDDDSYFVLLEDRKNGPSPYWVIEPENEM